VLRALRRRIGWVLLFAMLVAAGVSVYSLIQDEKYKARASVLLSSPQVLGPNSSSPARTPERQGATNLELAGREIIFRRAERRLIRSGEVSAADSVSSVEVTTGGESNPIEVEATAGNPRTASLVANTLAMELVAFQRSADRASFRKTRSRLRRELSTLVSMRRRAGHRQRRSLTRRIRSYQRRLDDLGVVASIQAANGLSIDRATPPSSPSSPKPVRNTLLGGLVGLLLGLGVALVREKTDRRLRDPDQLEEAFGLPVLACLPSSDALGRRLGMARELPPFEAAAFRTLRANLRSFDRGRDIDSVLITSPAAQDGKSTVAFNLAAAAAATDLEVLLIEAEVRRPALARALGLPTTEGLTSVLAGDVPLSDACQEVLLMHAGAAMESIPTMDILVAGEWRSDASQLVESERMQELLRECRRHYSLVVVDTPPAGLVSDAIGLMSDVSAVIVVGRVGKLTREQAARLRGQLEKIDAPAFGVVANFTDPHEGSYDPAGYELAGSR
jgi:capsular exopolysaccharide synthesis family protein